MNKLINSFGVISLFLLILNGCLRNPDPGSSYAVNVLPNVTGSSGEVLVVLDNTLWKGDIGTLIREILEQEYPALPQPEPLFDVIHISPGALDNMFKTHRSIVLLNVSSQDSVSTIKYTENTWAKPQIIVNVNAPDSKSLAEILQKNKERIVYTLLTYDRKRIGEVYKSSKDQSIKNLVSKMNVNISVPRGYTIDVNTEDFILLSIESSKTSQGLIIYKYPYLGPKNLLTESLIEKRNDFLMKYTVGTRPGSYMTTSRAFTPIVYDLVKGNRKYIEIRGLYELHNGFMGGPFLSHTTLDEARNQIVTVEAYAYNPGDKKRQLMRQLEAIVYSFEIIE